VILNSNTSSHDLYLPRRRAQKLPPKKADHPIDRQIDGNPNGSLEEKQAWMRARQQQRGMRKAKGASA